MKQKMIEFFINIATGLGKLICILLFLAVCAMFIFGIIWILEQNSIIKFIITVIIFLIFLHWLGSKD